MLASACSINSNNLLMVSEISNCGARGTRFRLSQSGITLRIGGVLWLWVEAGNGNYLWSFARSAIVDLKFFAVAASRRKNSTPMDIVNRLRTTAFTAKRAWSI